MKPNDFLELYKYIGLLIAIVTPAYLLINQVIKNRRAHQITKDENDLKIGIEKAKQNSVGEDELSKINSKLDEIKKDVFDEVEKLWKKFNEVEESWERFEKGNREVQQNFTEQSKIVVRQAETMVNILREWREGMYDAERKLKGKQDG